VHLKASGAAVLRDGAYLVPDTDFCREMLASVERDILAINGTGLHPAVVDPDGGRFVELFDRSDDYSKLRAEIENCGDSSRGECTVHHQADSQTAQKATNN